MNDLLRDMAGIVHVMNMFPLLVSRRYARRAWIRESYQWHRGKRWFPFERFDRVEREE